MSFSNELKSIITAPIWEPEYTTIDRLMSQITGLESCDSIVAVTKLYEVYSNALKHCDLTPEPFDRFYAWGEKLLTSFDMVDKYMVDAKMLFCNISDLKEIDADNSYLDERQREIIKRFFNTQSLFYRLIIPIIIIIICCVVTYVMRKIKFIRNMVPE